MIKKDLVNKKVVRAISLGLSAVMLTTPMTALAHEATVDPNADTTDATIEDGISTESEAYQKVEATVEDAQISTADAMGAAEVDILKDVSIDTDPKADAVADILDYADVAEDEKKALDELLTAETGLIKAEAAEKAAEVDVKEFDAIKEKIDANNALVEEAEKTVTDAVTQTSEALAEAEAASTKEAAQAAADKAAEAVAAAEEAQADAQAAYETNLKELQAAYEELESAKANLDAAKAALGGADTDVDEALAAVTAAEEKAAALKAALEEEAKTLEESKEAKLKAAYDNMIAQGTVNRVYRDFGSDVDPEDGIGDEWLDKFDDESASGAYWDAAREYFKLYIQYVYGDSFESAEFVKKNTLDNGLSYRASRDNTYIVKYKDADGNIKEAYYNYHTADKTGNIYIYEKEIATEVIAAKTQEQTVNVGLSIKNTDENAEVPFVKYEDVAGKDDVVVNTATDEEGNATAILVKDANSQLVDSTEISLDKNQTIDETKEPDVEYTQGTAVIYTYGTKENQVDYADRLGDYNNLVAKYNEFCSTYSGDDYRIEIVYDHGYGHDEIITLEEAAEEWRSINSDLGAWLDLGFELKVYQTVEDTSNILDQKEVDCIVKTTYTDVVTTTTGETTIDGFKDTWGWKGILWTCTSSAYDNAKAAAEAHKAQLEAQGYTNVSYEVHHLNIFDNKDGAYYSITYSSASTEKKAVKTETYTATAYENNFYTQTVVVEPEKEVKYWTERKNTTNDAGIAAKIKEVTEKLAEMVAKQDAAAAALAEATEARKDVENAKAALEGLQVGTAAYEAAMKAYDAAKTAFGEAEKTLAEINADVVVAQQNYADAAAELGRFVPTPSTGGESGGTTGGTTPTTPVVPGTETAEGETVVTPVATGAGAGAAVVDIEDEDTPLAAGIDNDANANGEDDEEVIVAEAEDNGNGAAIVDIEDEETPLAAGTGADAKMSWWWLLIVALLGSTGYAMYRNHQKKKEAQEA